MKKPTASRSLEKAAQEAMSLVRWAGQNDMGRVRLSLHAKEQMSERGLVFRDIEQVFKHGDFITAQDRNARMHPAWGRDEGEVRIVVSFRPIGAREMAVATIVVGKKKSIFVKTVMWRDER